MSKRRHNPKDNRVTDAGCWKAVNDNTLPNPADPDPDPDPKRPKSRENLSLDEWEKRVTEAQKHDTKVIMAHEFRENPDGFKAMAQAVADSYNDQHKLVVGEELPLGLKEEDDG